MKSVTIVLLANVMFFGCKTEETGSEQKTVGVKTTVTTGKTIGPLLTSAKTALLIECANQYYYNSVTKVFGGKKTAPELTSGAFNILQANQCKALVPVGLNRIQVDIFRGALVGVLARNNLMGRFPVATINALFSGSFVSLSQADTTLLSAKIVEAFAESALPKS